MSLIWTVSGAGRAVGKTTVARSIADVVENSVYCKCGHNPPKPGKPGNFFLDIEALTGFVDCASGKYENIVVESNSFVYSGRSDITIYIDGVEGRTNFRGDADRLRTASDIVIAADSLPGQWNEFLAEKISDIKTVEAVCDIFLNQRKWLFCSEPRVCSKIWFEAGGDHVFGRGLAILLENIARFGTLQAAAESSNMSYRYAWNMIKTAETHLCQSLIERHTGGKGGGGSRLSPKGKSMLESFRLINKEVAEFAEKRYRQLCSGENNNA